MSPEVKASVAGHTTYARMGHLAFLPGVRSPKLDTTPAAEEGSADVAAGGAYGHARLAGLVPLAAMREAAGGFDAAEWVGRWYARSAVGTAAAPFDSAVGIEAAIRSARAGFARAPRRPRSRRAG